MFSKVAKTGVEESFRVFPCIRQILVGNALLAIPAENVSADLLVIVGHVEVVNNIFPTAVF